MTTHQTHTAAHTDSDLPAMPVRVLERIEELSSLGDDDYRSTRVHIEHPVQFGENLSEDVTSLRWLRDATGNAARLTWTLSGMPLVPSPSLIHMHPPAGTSTLAAADLVADWQRRFRFGSFSYRVGPGFVTIKDVRDPLDASRMVITGADAQTFLSLAEGAELTGSEDADALALLEDAGLLLKTGSVRLVLPYRLRTWPVLAPTP